MRAKSPDNSNRKGHVTAHPAFGRPAPVPASGAPTTLCGLAGTAQRAFDRGITHMLNRRLPSCWSRSGFGWQELWEESDTAGFYASCDALLLLDAAYQRHQERSDIPDAFRTVFAQHLTRAIDPRVPAANRAQEQMRAQCLGVTMKLAKYVRVASLPLAAATDKARLAAASQRLLAGKARTGGGWGHHLASSKSSVVPTAEALVALGRCCPTSALRSAVDYLTVHLRSINDRSEAHRVLMAAWALATIAKPRDQILLATARDGLATLLARDRPTPSGVGRDHFYNPNTHASDYYSTNEHLLRAETTLLLYEKGALSVGSLYACLEAVRDATNQLASTGTFRRSPDEKVFFWEFYQAMSVASLFGGVVSTRPALSETQYMFVSPVHFHKHDFTNDEMLVVILMPMGKKWSNDIYKAFQGALHTLQLHAWRADNDKRDDAIMQEIWTHINRARFVIADCSGKNPNVFYELGIAHTIGKHVFLCAQLRSDFPFDIAAIRSAVYGTLPNEVRALKKDLIKFAKSF